ncbi:MAG: autotransporter domain-containing protein [Alphaproteobacteria bacterium]|nr:autotransporter domain-containing protein [Alphaproteobacteria bacterium]
MKTQRRGGRVTRHKGGVAGIALGAVLFTLPFPAYAQCITDGTTVTCTGNVLDGVIDGVDFFAPPVSIIEIFDITGNITPAVGVNGLLAQTSGANEPLVIAIDIAPFSIVTQGSMTEGIRAETDGDNSDLTLTNRSAIITDGIESPGIFAQTNGNNSDLTLTNRGAIATQGEFTLGIVARSQGTDGSVAVDNWGAITTDGFEGSGILGRSLGANSPVAITNFGAITTHDYLSRGILAQSNKSNSGVTVINRGVITTLRAESRGIDATIEGTANNSPITIENWARIATAGDGADGIFTLSEGGFNPITVTNLGGITTWGDNSEGIVSDSVGNNSPVAINNLGVITTRGELAHGILTEAYSADSPIIVNNRADVIANGPDADGIRAIVLDASSPVMINLDGGIVRGGTGDGSGVDLEAVVGLSTVNVFAGTTVTTLGNNAIEGGGGDTINNWGIVTGNVDLGGGTNIFNNRIGGLFNAGTTVNLGGVHLLTNDGIFAPDGVGTLGTANVTGNFVQSGSGNLATDIRFGSLFADLTNVSGTSSLAGQVVPNVVDPISVQAGTEQAIIFTSAGGVTNAGLSVVDTAVIDYELLFPDGFSIVLGATVDFVPTGLNPNQTSVAQAVNAIQTTGGSAAVAPVVGGLVRVPDLSGLADAYDQLGPEIYLANGVTTLFAGLDFTDNLMSCETRQTGNVFIAEGQCLWAQFAGHWFDQDQTGQTIGFDQSAARLSGGVQAELTPDWRIGMAFGYEHGNLDTQGGRQTSQSDTVHGGAAIKYTRGNALLAAAVSAGHGWYDTTRDLAFGNFAGQATASHEISHVSSRLRGAFAFTHGAGYIKPMVDLNVSWIDMGGISESGGNGAGLTVNGTEETVLSVSPAVAFGWQHETADGTLVRPHLQVGVTVFDDPEFAAVSSFSAAPAGTPAIRTTMDTDRVIGEIAAGLDLLAANDTVVKVLYEGQVGQTTLQHSGSVRLGKPF